MDRRRWKGKGRVVDFELGVRDEGTGGEDGIVIPLDMVDNGVAYTVPIQLHNNQRFSLQIDTGSSDLWIASRGCSTSSCLQTEGSLYDSSGSTDAGANFSMSYYLSASASGPIVWDDISIGGYQINPQALAAVTDVQNEPLSPGFSGVLGLGPPLNSVIASTVPAVVNGNQDGAAWASNLFSLSPATVAPSSRFLSLALSRPGSTQIPSAFGIGRHPSSIVSNASLINYSTLVSDNRGTLFWKINVRAITVYVNGTTHQIQLGKSNSGAVFPSAVVDSGVPLILTTRTVANEIYAAIGVNPAVDGSYHVPCTTPLNMTITLDDRPELPLHPLDLTAAPPQDSQSQFCLGLIQADDSSLLNPQASTADMVLGVPFMRNVYTVMAYTMPNPDGSFPPSAGVTQTIQPQLGLMSLTNPTQALQEFNTVRVLNQPISGTSANGTGSGALAHVGGKHLAVGIMVLVGILSFFGVCGLLFAVWWFVFRKKYRGKTGSTFKMDKVAYMLTRTTPVNDGNTPTGGGGGGGLTEDELRDQRYERYMQRERRATSPTISSEATHVESEPLPGYGHGYGYGYRYGQDDDGVGFGVKKKQVVFEPQEDIEEEEEEEEEEEVWGPKRVTSWNSIERRPCSSDVPLIANQERHRSPSPPLPKYHQTESTAAHRPNPSVALSSEEERAATTHESLSPSTSIQTQVTPVESGDSVGVDFFDDMGITSQSGTTGVGVGVVGAGSRTRAAIIGPRTMVARDKRLGVFANPSAMSSSSLGLGQGQPQGEEATRMRTLQPMARPGNYF